MVSSVVSELGGKRKRGLKTIVTPSQKNMVSDIHGTDEHVISRTCVTNDHVDLAHHDSFVQMTEIYTKEVLPHTSTQVMLEKTSVFNIITRASHEVLLKTNKFVKQVSILRTFIYILFQIIFLEIFFH